MILLANIRFKSYCKIMIDEAWHNVYANLTIWVDDIIHNWFYRIFVLRHSLLTPQKGYPHYSQRLSLEVQSLMMFYH